jgi:hypothetical protein
MKTVEVNLYKYDELSEQAKENVLNMLSDLNVDHNWWDFVFEDAENIGLEIIEFDIYHNEISGHLIHEPKEVKKLIIKNHGKSCDTYKYVKGFDMRTIVDEYDFKYGLLEEYLSILKKEYDYLTSQEAIEETIHANEYEFTGSGNWPVF